MALWEVNQVEFPFTGGLGASRTPPAVAVFHGSFHFAPRVEREMSSLH